MATAPTIPLVPVEEYLNGGTIPDREYVDGVLIERPLPTILHGLLQVILIRLFGPYERAQRFTALSEVRTETVPLTRYRIPDVLIAARPGPKGKVMNVTPLAVIEILSPEDKMAEVKARFKEYAAIGTPLILLMDPEDCVAHRYENGSLIQTFAETLKTPVGSMPLDLAAIFEQLKQEYADFTGE